MYTPRKHALKVRKLPELTEWIGAGESDGRNEVLPMYSPGKLRRRKVRLGESVLPRGLASWVVQKSFEGVDPLVAQRLDAQVLERLGLAEGGNSSEAFEVYVVLERCHSCSFHHALTTRHDETQYSSLAKLMLDGLCAAGNGVIADAWELPCELDLPPWKSSLDQGVLRPSSRLGAFEIYLLTPPMQQQSGCGGVELPFDPSSVLSSQLAADGQRCESGGWGSRHILPCGYIISVLHSKLSTKTWPKLEDLFWRLQAAMPRAMVTLRLLEPSWQLISSFHVEVSIVDDDGPQAIVQGFACDGVLHIWGVPLPSCLVVRISHPTMRDRVSSIEVVKLKTSYTIGSDIFYELWASNVPGGMKVFARHYASFEPHWMEHAWPFVGCVSMLGTTSAEKNNVIVNGHMLLPWPGFDATAAHRFVMTGAAGESTHAIMLEPTLPFAAVKELKVDGYLPATLNSIAKSITMQTLRQIGSIELAKFEAPIARILVTLPDSAARSRPLPGTRVFVDGEQLGIANEQGRLEVSVRPGVNRVQFVHPDVVVEGVEQQLQVTSLKPHFVVCLPLALKVWRAPVSASAVLLAWEVWIALAGEKPLPNWRPPFPEEESLESHALLWRPARPAASLEGRHSDFEGSSHKLTSKGGVVVLEGSVAEELLEWDNANEAELDIFSELWLTPPFARRLDAREAVEALRKPWVPRCLGVVPAASKTCSAAAAQCQGDDFCNASASAGRDSVLVRISARTRCCGAFVPGVTATAILLIPAGPAVSDMSASAGDLVFEVPFPSSDVSDDAFLLEVSLLHPGLNLGHPVKFLVRPGFTNEVFIPVVFDTHFVLRSSPPLTLLGGTRHVLSATASFDVVPAETPLIRGRLHSIQPAFLELDDPFVSLAEASVGHGDRSENVLFNLPSAPTSQPNAGGCALTSFWCCARVHLDGFQWTVASGFDGLTLDDNSCGYVALLARAAEGRMTEVGALLPVFTFHPYQGGRLLWTLEDCPTVQSLAKQALATQSHLGSRHVGDLSIALEDRDGLWVAMHPEDTLHPGQHVHELCLLRFQLALGSSDVGVSNATVSITSGSLFAAPRVGTTDDTGMLRVFVKPSSDRISLSLKHSLFGMARHYDVAVLGPVVDFKVSIDVSFCVSMNPPPPGEDRAMFPISVWMHLVAPRMDASIANQRDDVTNVEHRAVYADALPVDTKVYVTSPISADRTGDVVEVMVDEHHLYAGTFPVFTLCKMDDPRRCIEPKVTIHCALEGYLWEPTATWFFDSVADLHALLSGPVCVGHLCPPITVRCYNLSGIDEESLEVFQAHLYSNTLSLICRLAEQARLPPESVALFQAEEMLEHSTPLRGFMTLDAWRMAPLDVHLYARCCLQGLHGVEVCVGEDYLMSSLRKVDVCKLPNTEAPPPCRLDRVVTTGADGRCRVWVNVGTHIVHVVHPMIRKGRRGSGTLEIIGKSMPWGFSVHVEPQDGGDFQPIEVPVCAELNMEMDETFSLWLRRDVPVVQNLHLAIGACGSPKHPIKNGVALPLKYCNNSKDMRCPLQDISVEICETEGRVWKSLKLQNSCPHIASATKDVMLGSFAPAITVLLETGFKLHLFADESADIAVVRNRLVPALGTSANDIGLFTAGGELLGNDVRCFAGQVFSASCLGTLKLLILVPEIEAAGEPAGVAGVLVEVDGRTIESRSDESGLLDVRIRVGRRIIRLLHPGFGAGGYTLEVDMHAEKVLQRTVFMELRVFVYSSAAESSETGGTSLSAQQFLVWVCACREQIPTDAQGVVGRALCAVQIGGVKKILGMWVLDGLIGDGFVLERNLVSSECGVVAGQDRLEFSTETHVNSFGPLNISSLEIVAQRDGHLWCPKNPSPLAERVTSMGGSEYKRLLCCPVVVGYLEPAIFLQWDISGGVGSTCSFEPVALKASDYPDLCALRRAVVRELKLLEGTFQLYRDGRLLSEEDAQVVPGDRVDVRELAKLSVRAFTSCCGHAAEGVRVILDDAYAGSIDAHGECECETTLGEHWVRLENLSEAMIRVVRGGSTLTLEASPDFFIYVSQDDSDEEEGMEQTSSEQEPSFYPSCVWIVAGKDQIPENASPLKACVVCRPPPRGRHGPFLDGSLLTASLDAASIRPFSFKGFAGFVGTSLEPQSCVLGSLRVRCHMSGFKWCPKKPFPLEERLGELGGCESLRLLHCPVALGFLRPSILVQLAQNSERLQAPLESFGGRADGLYDWLLSELDTGQQHVTLEFDDGTPLVSCKSGKGKEDLLLRYCLAFRRGWQQASLAGELPLVLCARPSETIAAARKALQDNVEANDTMQLFETVTDLLTWVGTELHGTFTMVEDFG